MIEAMKKANSIDPAKFVPEVFNVSFTGATGKVEFDAKGDRKDAEMTIFRMGKDGKIAPVAVVKNGVSTPFGRRLRPPLPRPPLPRLPHPRPPRLTRARKNRRKTRRRNKTSNKAGHAQGRHRKRCRCSFWGSR